MTVPPHHHSGLPSRVLQERSPNVQSEGCAPIRGPLLKVEVPSRYGGRECRLTNRAGDHVLRFRHFYQLDDMERRHYDWLFGEASKVHAFKKYRDHYRDGLGQKTKGNQDVWDDIREDLFFKGEFIVERPRPSC